MLKTCPWLAFGLLNLFFVSQVQEWKEKALSSENKTNEVEAELSVLHDDLERLRKEQNVAKGTKCLSIPMDTRMSWRSE